MDEHNYLYDTGELGCLFQLKRVMDEHTYGTVTREMTDSYRMLARKVDKVCRVLFPVTYAAFNVTYWSFYLTRTD